MRNYDLALILRDFGFSRSAAFPIDRSAKTVFKFLNNKYLKQGY